MLLKMTVQRAYKTLKCKLLVFPYFKGFDQRMVQLRALGAQRYLGTKYGGQSYLGFRIKLL